jgi:hypothetical protein
LVKNESTKILCSFHLLISSFQISFGEGIVSNDVVFKPYGELLTQAERYHQEFIDRYDDLNKVALNG